MVDAKVIKKFTHSKFSDVRISIVKWPMSVVRIASTSKNSLVKFASEILNSWREYSDENGGIYAFTEENGKKIPHNTITPIARKNDEGLFELDLVLRNNRTSKEYPDGIYHPHKHLHHIKKENIGLIEVMGLAILPPRINTDLISLSEVLQGIKSLDFVKEKMLNHYDWFLDICNKNPGILSKDLAEKTIQDAVAYRFSEVLECAGVFKQTETGIKSFEKFMLEIGCN